MRYFLLQQKFFCKNPEGTCCIKVPWGGPAGPSVEFAKMRLNTFYLDSLKKSGYHSVKALSYKKRHLGALQMNFRTVMTNFYFFWNMKLHQFLLILYNLIFQRFGLRLLKSIVKIWCTTYSDFWNFTLSKI